MWPVPDQTVDPTYWLNKFDPLGRETGLAQQKSGLWLTNIGWAGPGPRLPGYPTQRVDGSICESNRRLVGVGRFRPDGFGSELLGQPFYLRFNFLKFF